MNLIKTSFLNGIAVIIKMLTLLGINKIIALYVGPGGYAVVGQFQNAIQMVSTFGTGAINSGVTKYTAEYATSSNKTIILWRTSGTIILGSSIVCSIILFYFSKELSHYFLNDVDYALPFKCFSISLPLLTVNSYLLSVLNGKKEIKKYVIANIIGSISSILFIFILAFSFELQGVLIALVTYQSVSFFATLTICFRCNWFDVYNLFGRVDKKILRNLAKYTLMALVAALTVPLSQIAVRTILVDSFGLNHAGYWDAMWRLSSAYIMFATTTLGVYFLPRLSELNDIKEIKKEIIKGYKLIIPTFIFISILVYLLRDILILILFSEDFKSMRSLFAFQLTGDVLKICGWLLAFLMISKTLVKEYIIAQVISTICFPAFTYILIKDELFGFEGVALAHMLTFLVYFLLCFSLIRKSKLYKENSNE